MDFIFWIIIAIVVFSISSNKKKKQEEARKKARENTAWQAHSPDGSPNMPGMQPPPAPTEVWPWAQASPTPKPPVAGSQEGWPWSVAQEETQPKVAGMQERWSGEGSSTMEGRSQEGGVQVARHKETPRVPLKSTLAHTLRPATQPRSHAHQETSMTGEELCPPVKQQESAKLQASQREKQLKAPLTNVLRMDRESIVTGLLYMEILGKPKSMRPSRLNHS